MRLLDNDQRRETINTRQRYAAFREAKLRLRGYRGSMVWSATKGTDYLLHSSYPEGTGRRSQRSLGARSPETERIKLDFDSARSAARRRLKTAQAMLDRQAALNRALGLGRVPLTSARIIRALDDIGVLGKGLRIVGTNALYAYEAASGVFVDPDITTTEDIDLLFDSRRELRFVASRDLGEAGLMGLLRRIDGTFERGRETFRAVNNEGFLVDLIMPAATPPWKQVRDSLVGVAEDLTAVAIAGLEWLENAPPFEAVAIDERGVPLRIVAVDPRVFCAHKLWLSGQPSRDPLKRERDRAQAEGVGQLVARHLTHLTLASKELAALPRAILDAARPLFEARAEPPQNRSP
ncbi:nucleotidyltransferase domain-containing protein [Bosea sp. 124]|uniref:GSU2403 family nucleotidyltransferase fold protein n=1 Tax=Bosea sp. 124 TaxID=2135642 RepID=UPI000D383E49|nr:nucleotidyltransferase domain-containing protein [Bosea sp. 124]PTM38876.1 hypothetical protein C8D03_0351 [Bosea sp. 124]